MYNNSNSNCSVTVVVVHTVVGIIKSASKTAFSFNTEQVARGLFGMRSATLKKGGMVLFLYVLRSRS